MASNIRRGKYIPHGTFSDGDDEIRRAYYYYGYRRDEDLPELPVMEPDEEVYDPEEDHARRELYSKCVELIEELTPREAFILRLRFGFGCADHSLEQVARVVGVTRERIRQIEAKAIRKLKSPSRREALKEHLDPESSVEKAERLRLYAIEQEKLARETMRHERQRREQASLRRQAKKIQAYKVFVRRPEPWITHLKETEPDLYQKLQDIAQKLHHQQMFEQYEEVQLPDR